MRVKRQHWEIARPKVVSLKPEPSTKPDFIDAAFSGRMTPEDMVYMARAILQLCDEAAELRQRVRVLEMARGVNP